MNRKRWIGWLMLLAMAALAGCTESSPTNPDPSGAAGAVVTVSGCNDATMSGGWDGTPPNLDCVYYDYDGLGTLNLLHANTAFNCCPEEIYAEISIEDGTIVVREFETNGICNCICLYDVGYLIEDLPPGLYQLTVEGFSLPAGEEPLVCQLELYDMVSGEHCVERTRYPWG